MGIVAVLVVGVAVIVFGALTDRRRNRKATAEMLSPPDRRIPRFAPDAPAPHYLSELQARRRPSGSRSTDLAADDRSALARQLDEPGTIKIRAGMLSTDFVTDAPTGWAVLDQPYVLVCSDPVATVRELIAPLERVLPTGRPLLVVAPSFAPEVKQTLEVNAIQQTMGLLAVAVSDTDARRIATLTGATPLPRSDLQSGDVSLEVIGRCPRWVSTSEASFALAAEPRSQP